MRTGITRGTVAALLLLLIAAGGIWLWTQESIERQQEQAQERLENQLSIRGFTCSAATDRAEFFLKNTGPSPLDGSAVTVYLYNESTEEPAATASADAGEIDVGEIWDSSVSFAADMVAGQEYRVVFEFTNERDARLAATCQA
ncbi:MAG: hypothetical protein SVW77_03665 [Candidatus Nanohaloarchaea archaeon]|nr:hypothetical protein [Candidatus Nanohaloarchaea archaeon]